MLCGARIMNFARSFRFLRFSVAVIQNSFSKCYNFFVCWLRNEDLAVFASRNIFAVYDDIIVLLVGWFGFLAENESVPRFRRNKIWRLNRPFHFPRTVEAQFEFVRNAIPSPSCHDQTVSPTFFLIEAKLTVHNRQRPTITTM